MFLIRKILNLVFLKTKNIFSVVFCKIKYLVNCGLFLKGNGKFSAIAKSKYFIFLLFFGISIGGIVFGFQVGFIKNGSAIIKQSFERSLSLNNENQLKLLTDVSSTESDTVSDNLGNSNIDKNIGISSSSNIVSNDELNQKTESIVSKNIMTTPDFLSTDTLNNEIVNIEQDNIKSSNISSTSSTPINSSNSNRIYSKPVLPKRCEFSSSRKNKPSTVVLNEIAWMGSPSSTSNTQIISGGQNDEWIELKNATAEDISLSNWQIIDSVKNINIYFSEGDKINSNSFYLLKRAKNNSSSTILIDKIYSGSLLNSGDRIGIFDNNCSLIDEIDASLGWPGGDNVSKKTLERNADNIGWHTSDKEGGTPRTMNSEGYKNTSADILGNNFLVSSTILSINQDSNLSINTSTNLSISTSTIPNINKYLVFVSIVGDGSSKIINDSSSINCGNGENKCSVYLNEKDFLKLKAVPSSNAVFVGWSGACFGSSYDCSIPINGNVSISGIFRNKDTNNNLTNDDHNIPATSIVNSNNEDISVVSSSSQSSSIESQNIINIAENNIIESTTSSDNSFINNKSLLDHLVLFSVQISGASSSNDYVKIYNPLTSDIQIGGFKLRKKSKTGTDYSIKEFPSGTLIKANGFFVWANSNSNFASSINADVSSGVELSANNSIALFDKNGSIIDALAWGNGIDQYVEGSAFIQNPENSQILERISKDGYVVDTNNDSTDFTIL